MTNPIIIATRGKGPSALVERAYNIYNRYGLTSTKMKLALSLFSQILKRFNCGASFAITAVVLKRHHRLIAKYFDQNIEFVVHGYTHIDYSELEPQQLLANMNRACAIFHAAGIDTPGFRSPYLRRGENLTAALQNSCFSFVSNQPIWWDVLTPQSFTSAAYLSYNRAFNFYAPWLAAERPSLPHLLNDKIVEIPVSLPDDEILVDRLGDEINRLIGPSWQAILAETYQRGELFTIQLHPERIWQCQAGLTAVLTHARTLSPGVWIARLNEIAAWWHNRATAQVDIQEIEAGVLQLTVNGPDGVTILARGVEIFTPSSPWLDNYQQIRGLTCRLQAGIKPFIGVASFCPPELINFLRQQGYITQISNQPQHYSIYLDQAEFTPHHERPLLARLEQGSEPLVRLGRWPDGARSAISITGDIDALTLWDYGLRLFGK